MGIKRLVERSVYTLKNEGAKMFVLKTKTYLANRKARKDAVNQPMLKKIFADVLFINGCYLPHPSRYRVSHQKEQLFANGLVSEEVFYTELDLSLVKRFRAFIFFRCPCTENVEEFIKVAKAENKLVLCIEMLFLCKIQPFEGVTQRHKQKNGQNRFCGKNKTIHYSRSSLKVLEEILGSQTS